MRGDAAKGVAGMAAAPLAFTTPTAAEHFGDNVRGLTDYESASVELPDGRTMTVTAVPAHHGPEGVREAGGPVTGFVLTGTAIPTTYISGDNSDIDLVTEIREHIGPIDVAILFAGGAWFDAFGPGINLTLGNEAVLAVSQLIPEALIIPAHVDSWAHFHENVDDMAQQFAEHARAEHLAPLKPGESISIACPRSFSRY